MESRYYPWCGCDRCDTDVVMYCPVVAGCDKEQTGPQVRGVTGVTLTWLCTVLWLKGVIESKPYPWYGCDRCDIDVVTYRPVIARCDRCDTDVVTYRPVIAACDRCATDVVTYCPVIARCDRCDTDVVTYRTVVSGCGGEQALPVVRGVTGVTLTWLRTVL